MFQADDVICQDILLIELVVLLSADEGLVVGVVFQIFGTDFLRRPVILGEIGCSSAILLFNLFLVAVLEEQLRHGLLAEIDLLDRHLLQEALDDRPWNCYRFRSVYHVNAINSAPVVILEVSHHLLEHIYGQTDESDVLQIDDGHPIFNLSWEKVVVQNKLQPVCQCGQEIIQFDLLY